jgi:hypothetical protein
MRPRVDRRDELERIDPPVYFSLLADVDVPDRGGLVRCPLSGPEDRTPSCSASADPERGWSCPMTDRSVAHVQPPPGPAERDNTRATKSGATAKLAIAELTPPVIQDLQARYPHCPPEMIRTQAARLVALELAGRWVGDRGSIVLNTRGAVPDLVRRFFEWSARSDRWFEKCEAEARERQASTGLFAAQLHELEQGQVQDAVEEAAHDAMLPEGGRGETLAAATFRTSAVEPVEHPRTMRAVLWRAGPMARRSCPRAPGRRLSGRPASSGQRLRLGASAGRVLASRGVVPRGLAVWQASDRLGRPRRWLSAIAAGSAAKRVARRTRRL